MFAALIGATIALVCGFSLLAIQFVAKYKGEPLFMLGVGC